MLILLCIAAVVLLVLVWLLYAQDDLLTDAKANLASQKVLTELTQKDADRYLRFYELECAGREQDGVEAREALSTLEHDYALKSLVVRQQVERINFLTRSKRGLMNSLELATNRINHEVERGNALAEQCQHTARKLQEYRDTVSELLSFTDVRPTLVSKHPRLAKILRALDDVHQDRI